MTETAPSVLVFDVNETLLDLRHLEPLFERVFGRREVLREWFPQLVLYSQSMTLSGLYAPFGEITAGALRMVARTHGASLSDDDVSEFSERIGTMPAHADAAPALERLSRAGYRLVTLTNSAPGEGPSPLERAGLSGVFERSFSVAEVRRFKPAPETYGLVAQELGVALPELCMIACHFWDTLGANAAGCRAAMIEREGNAVLPAEGVPQPEIVVPDMEALTDEIIARWGSPRG